MNDNEELESIAKEKRQKFSVWLVENNLQDYAPAFEEEGFNDLAVLVELSDAEVEELASGLRMRMGHKKTLPIAIRNLKKKKTKEEKREHQKEEEEDRRLKREQEKEEEEERRLKRKRSKEEMTEKHPKEQKEEPTLTVHKTDSVIMPANKDYFAFLSHKKKNSKLGSATEGLALRVGDM